VSRFRIGPNDERAWTGTIVHGSCDDNITREKAFLGHGAVQCTVLLKNKLENVNPWWQANLKVTDDRARRGLQIERAPDTLQSFASGGVEAPWCKPPRMVVEDENTGALGF
jgi:hypothetical protein